MNRKALVNAILIGTALQLAMIVAGHFVPYVKDHVFMFGGLTLSLVAGLIYGYAAKGSWPDSLLGGVIAGAVCAFIGLVASMLWGDVPRDIILLATLSSGVTGAVGGAIGKLIGR